MVFTFFKIQQSTFQYFLLGYCLIFGWTLTAQTPFDYLRQDTFLARVMADPSFEVQIRYSTLAAKGKLNTHIYTCAPERDPYFYPASTVKLPLCALALEKIHELNKKYKTSITRETAYRTGEVAGRPAYQIEPTAENKYPSIAQDIRLVLTISDNDAYNRLCDFVGLAETERKLHKKGYRHTDIVHRVGIGGGDNRNRPYFQFFSAEKNILLLPEERETIERSKAYTLKLHSKGQGYYKGDSLVMEPFDMGAKNRFALQDMERLLVALLLPESAPKKSKFNLDASDYAFLQYWMSVFPRESRFPTFDSQTYYDGYCKFLIYGDDTIQRPNAPRIFNKVGDAYGTLSDAAFIVDASAGVVFFCSVTMLCNSDGIFNDDAYDYESVGFPFFARVGQQLYTYTLNKKMPPTIDLQRFMIDYDKRL